MIPPIPSTWWEEPTRMYEQMVRERVTFSQANYGDGEWGCMLGLELTNSQGEVYNPTLADGLRRTLLEHRGHWCGTNPGKKLLPQVEAFVAEHGLGDLPWVFKETLSAANCNGGLAGFLHACRTRDIVLVGPRHLAKLPAEVLPVRAFIQVPDSTAWEIYEETAAVVARRARPHSLVLFASGMGTNLTIHHLLADPEMSTATMLDIGAILDPYVGVFSRKAYRKPQWQNAKERNLA